ncbi:MAG: hypothetical protein GWN00_29900 [Aliifodinibius sp.]|nr:hypothetical protein [Fodinibius sp.]NIY28852.1 hypothetical protein [Fodinibius sp.]
MELKDDQNQTITIRLAGETPSAILSISVKKADVNALGTLDPIRANHGSVVTLEITGKPYPAITIELQGKDASAILSAVLSITQPFQLITDYTKVNGIAELLYQEENSLTYRIQLREDSPFVLFTGTGSLRFKMQIPLQETANFFSTVAIPISALDFTRQDGAGNRVSAVFENGEISYPDYPNIEKVSFEAPDFIGLDRLEQFYIKNISLDPLLKGMRFQLGGVAGHVVTKSGPFLKDCRLSKFDTLWQNPRLIILLSIIVWVFPTSIGAYRLYKNFKED